MATAVTSTELAKGLSDILNRIYYQGESFVVERNGQPVASLVPIAAPARPRVTWREVVDAAGDLPLLDPGFADDLEAIQSEQPLMEDRPWDS